jgi:hypothetical protein
VHTPRSNDKFRLYNLALNRYLAVRTAQSSSAYLSDDINSPDTLFFIVPLRTEERTRFQNGNSFGLLTVHAGVHIHVSTNMLVTPELVTAKERAQRATGKVIADDDNEQVSSKTRTDIPSYQISLSPQKDITLADVFRSMSGRLGYRLVFLKIYNTFFPWNAVNMVADDDLDDFYYVKNIVPMLREVATFTTREVAKTLMSQTNKLPAADSLWFVVWLLFFIMLKLDDYLV